MTRASYETRMKAREDYYNEQKKLMLEEDKRNALRESQRIPELVCSQHVLKKAVEEADHDSLMATSVTFSFLSIDQYREFLSRIGSSYVGPSGCTFSADTCVLGMYNKQNNLLSVLELRQRKACDSPLSAESLQWVFSSNIAPDHTVQRVLEELLYRVSIEYLKLINKDFYFRPTKYIFCCPHQDSLVDTMCNDFQMKRINLMGINVWYMSV